VTTANTTPRSPVALQRREWAVGALLFAIVFAGRVWGIGTRFLLLGDQMRDWDIALRPLADLPLVGPPTHVHGYTIGPAFYWILWLIRVVLGPWFENLPHAGGIGQALLQSAADVLLLVALWRRLGRVWMPLATIALIATAPFDLSLAAIVWNPTMGSTLAKVATALILLDWHRRSAAASIVAFAVVWMAVQAYTGAIFVAVAVFATALIDPLLERDRKLALRNAATLAGVVLVLQVPYLAYRFSHPGEPAMAAVTGSVADIVTGRSMPRFSASIAGYVSAFDGIALAPWHVPIAGWGLLACSIVVMVRYRNDASLVLMSLVPQALAIVGYSFFLSGLDNYYYLSLMPAAVITVTLALDALSPARFRQGIGVGCFVLALAVAPTRWNQAMTMNQMPEYGAIVHASRVIADRGTPVRSVRTDFRLPPTNDPEFVYRILGGRLDPASPWVAVIQQNGDVTYQNARAM
jgi:hypothetical protein